MKRLLKVGCLGLATLVFCLFSINYVSALNTSKLVEVNVNFNDWNKVGCSEQQPFDERQAGFEKYTENTILPENCTSVYSLVIVLITLAVRGIVRIQRTKSFQKKIGEK